MTIFGYEIQRKAAVPVGTQLASATSRSAWSSIYRVLESFAGAWQTNVEVTLTDVLSHPIVYACISLISSDIGKMGGARLVMRDDDRIWTEFESAAFSPVLRKPNHYQNSIQFAEQWMVSKLGWGNTYVLLLRDQRQVVTSMYVLDPQRVTPLVAPNGDVYYELRRDDLSAQPLESVVVPATEIIHDRMNCWYHPLVGLPPIHACGLAAVMGLKILNNSANLFANGSRPGGILTAPGDITQETADRMKANWDANYTGDNFGKVAVLGNGLTYTPMAFTAVDTQVTEQSEAVNRLICAAFGVPAHMVGVGPNPLNNNVAALGQQYYNQCLQRHIEAIERLLDDGLGLSDGKIEGKQYGTEFDTSVLLRMDTASLMAAIQDGMKAGVLTPNEGRFMLNRPPVKGGATPYLQIQNSSIAAIDWREQQEMVTPPAPPALAAPAVAAPIESTRSFEALVLRKAAELAAENAVLSAA